MKAEAPNMSILQALGYIFTQGNLYAYDIAMSSLRIDGFMLNYLFFRQN
jgi:hypothetical protein